MARMTTRTLLVEESCRILRQGIDLVAALDDELYKKPQEPVTTSGIGGHIRHCIDHVQCLLAGLAQGRVDYDRRERDPRVESDRRHAIRGLRRAIDGLAAIDAARDYGALAIKTDAPEDAPASWTSSSLERELQSLISHTVHHFALIAFLVRLNGVETAEGFGVARSTLTYWKERSASQAGHARP
jgi:hypothetical protein